VRYWTWWKSDSRITKQLEQQLLNEDPITEEGVIEILGTDPAGIEAVLAKIKSITFKPQMNVAYEVKVIKMLDLVQ
jgi:polyribonucleotide nucleotidyltransferase